jgi:hypothetical protein
VDGIQCASHFHTLYSQMVCLCMLSCLMPEGSEILMLDTTHASK